MIVNQENAQTIIFRKQKTDYSNDTIEFDNKKIEPVFPVQQYL